MDLGQRILEYRAEMGINQAKFAIMANLTPLSVRAIEHGGKCRETTRIRIERIIGKEQKSEENNS